MSEKSITSGVLVIDKPVGPTSHDIVVQLRRQLNVPQIGHSGTLDPFASGLLLVAVGSATRLIEYTHGFAKTYEAVIALGAESTTDDTTGTLTEHIVKVPPTKEDIEKVLARFTGNLQQQPPRYAAIKVGGKKLYEYARQSQSITIPPRAVVIHEISLQHYTYPHLALSARVSSGTYIRALARDIGEALGTGGYASQLRRTAIGPFSLRQATAPERLTATSLATHLLPAQALVAHLVPLTLTPAEQQRFRQGQAVPLPQKAVNETLVAIVDGTHRLLGIGRVDPSTHLVRPEKVIIVA